MPKKFYALALDEEQTRAVMAACTTTIMQIEINRETYDKALADANKTSMELIGLYANIVMYIGDKLEQE